MGAVALPWIAEAVYALGKAIVVTATLIFVGESAKETGKVLSEKLEDLKNKSEELPDKDVPGTCQGGCKEPKKGKKVRTSETGDKVRTPDSHPEDFDTLPGRQGKRNRKTGEIWVEERPGRDHMGEKWDVSHGGRRVGEVKADGTVGRRW